MKHFVIALCLFSSIASAQSIKITESLDGEEWFGNPETFVVSSNMIKMSVERRIFGKKTLYIDIATNKTTCWTRKGDLYASDSNGLTKTKDVFIDNDNISDHLARSLCIIFDIAVPKKWT